MAPETRVAIGIGLRPGTPENDVRLLVLSILDPTWTVTVIATLDRRASDPAVLALADHFGVRVRPFTAESLATVDTPTRSETTAAAVGTASVAEAAALLAAGAQTLTRERAASRTVVVAVAAVTGSSLAI